MTDELVAEVAGDDDLGAQQADHRAGELSDPNLGTHGVLVAVELLNQGLRPFHLCSARKIDKRGFQRTQLGRHRFHLGADHGQDGVDRRLLGERRDERAVGDVDLVVLLRQVRIVQTPGELLVPVERGRGPANHLGATEHAGKIAQLLDADGRVLLQSPELRDHAPLVTGTARAGLEGECARCLEPIRDDIEVRFQELFVYDDGKDEAASSLEFGLERRKKVFEAEFGKLQSPVEPALAAKLAGTWENPLLGKITVKGE